MASALRHIHADELARQSMLTEMLGRVNAMRFTPLAKGSSTRSPSHLRMENWDPSESLKTQLGQ